MARLIDQVRARARARVALAQARIEAVQDRVIAFDAQGGVEGWAERMLERLEAQEQRIATGRHPMMPQYRAQIRVWYARLELEPDADADAVRKAFRALMRRYHPDRFSGDTETEALATSLSQDLAVAYEGLLEYLR